MNDCFDTTVRTTVLLNLGHEKLGKVMKSHRILIASKSTNPELFMDRDGLEVHKHAKDKERGEFPAILTKPVGFVNNGFII